MRALLVGAGIAWPARHRGLYAECAQPTLQPAGKIPDQLGLGVLAVDGALVVPAVSGIDDDPFAQQARPGDRHRDLLAQELRAPADHAPPFELAEGAHRRRTADTVGHQSVFPLEGAQAI